MDLMEFLTAYWQWIVLGLLVLDKIVAVTPCKWDDLILTSLKGALRSVTGRKLAGVVLLCILAAGVSACAVKATSDLPAHEQARVYVDVLMDTCTDVEAAYRAEWEAADSARRAWLGPDVGHSINLAHEAIALAGQAAHAWGVAVDSGGDSVAAQAKYQLLIEDAKDLLTEAMRLWETIHQSEEG